VPRKKRSNSAELVSLERIVRNMATDRRLLAATAAIALAGLLLVAASAFVRLCEVEVELTVHARSVTLQLAGAAQDQNPGVVLSRPGPAAERARLTADGFKKVDIGKPDCGVTDGVQLDGALSLEMLNLGTGTQFGLDVTEPALRLRIMGSGSFDIGTAGPVKVSPTAGRASPCDAAPWVVAFTAGPSSRPASATLTWAAGQKPRFILSNVKVSQLSFDWPATGPAANRSESTIEDGQIRIEDQTPVKLGASEMLTLSGLNGYVGNLSFSGGRLSVIFKGTARGVEIGPRDFRRDLRPTYFHYFKDLKWLVTIFSLISFIFACAWGFRTWVRNERARDEPRR
jgi:hypothetical protein